MALEGLLDRILRTTTLLENFVMKPSYTVSIASEVSGNSEAFSSDVLILNDLNTDNQKQTNEPWHHDGLAYCFATPCHSELQDDGKRSDFILQNCNY